MDARFSRSGLSAGSGTRPVTGTASSGLLPQVTMGAIAAASSVTSRSKRALGSLGRLRQNFNAESHLAPLGAKGRPLRYSIVVSSGAIMPARALASTDMLQ